MDNQKRLYTKNQIDIATFIGGPLVAGYLLSHNFKTFNDKRAAKNTLIISVVSLLALIFSLAFLPSTIVSRIPNLSIGLIPVIITGLVVRQYQSKKIEDLIKLGYKTASPIKVFGVSLLSLALTLVLYFIIIQTTTYLNVKYNYSGYLNNYCNTDYVENKIENSKVYVPEDASCFVYDKLKTKGHTLAQVDHVLTLEFEYQKSIGLVDSQQVSTGTSAPYEPLPYIIQNKKINLTENQILEILDTETDYLVKIGVAQVK